MTIESDPSPSDLVQRSADAYDHLAPEYYASDLHPTCANFGVINDAILNSFRPLISHDGIYLEIGCGMGRLDRIRGASGTILTDACEPMLRLARHRTPGDVLCEKMDAFRPHFNDESVHGIFAFLIDPYNHALFFRQVHRILRAGAYLVFTVPSHVWAMALRGHLQVPLDETVFLDRTGKEVRAPSITRSLVDQSNLLTDLGFRVLSTQTLTLESAPATAPSHHVLMAANRLGVEPQRVPLLDVFIATRPN
jgi:SAM-dependent methyltransferase